MSKKIGVILSFVAFVLNFQEVQSSAQTPTELTRLIVGSRQGTFDNSSPTGVNELGGRFNVSYHNCDGSLYQIIKDAKSEIVTINKNAENSSFCCFVPARIKAAANVQHVAIGVMGKSPVYLREPYSSLEWLLKEKKENMKKSFKAEVDSFTFFTTCCCCFAPSLTQSHLAKVNAISKKGLDDLCQMEQQGIFE